MPRYQKFAHYPIMALDTETTGLNWPVDKMFGFSITTPEWSQYHDIRVDPRSLQWLADEIKKFRGTLVFFNATFDIKMLVSAGVRIPVPQVDDVAIRACLIDEHRTTIFPWSRKNMNYSLDSLAETCLGKRKVVEIYQELAEEFGGQATKNVQMPNLQRAHPQLVAPYAIADTDLTLELWHWQEAEIERQGIRDICEFERRVFPHVLEQEMTGLRVDLDAASRAQMELTIEIERQKRDLNKLVGKDFNVNSTPQIRDYFNPKQLPNGKWVLADGTPCKSTPKGNPSIDNDVLHAIEESSPVASGIINIRSLIRTCDTFLGKHVLGSAVGDRVYPNINQVASEDGGTKTGRFSYTAPALQQIPNRNKTIAAIVKPCFLPDEGQTWLDCDLNSFEVRVFAHLVGAFNDSLVRQYAEKPDTDFHQWVADLMGVPRNPRPEGGANAKQLNLSMIFNSGKGSIAQQLGLPTSEDSFVDDFGKTIHYYKAGSEGESIVETYHRRVQGVKELAQVAKERAESRGYLRTMYGRHIRFPRKFKSYKASGLLIQSTAADINKENWIIIAEALAGRGRLMLNTHDSYSLSVERGREKEVWKDVKSSVERSILRVPLILDLNGHGSNWWAALQKAEL
jgi:DNA polymerase I-like protein with 3'-5' exonuclease and polymerase domains